MIDLYSYLTVVHVYVLKQYLYENDIMYHLFVPTLTYRRIQLGIHWNNNPTVLARRCDVPLYRFGQNTMVCQNLHHPRYNCHVACLGK